MRRAALIFLLALVAYALTAAGHLFSPDEEVMFRTARALAGGHGFAIEPLMVGEDGFASRPAQPPRPDGREFAQYGIAQPILAVPLVWLGQWLARVGDDALWQRLHGLEPYHPGQMGVALTAAELAPRWACSWFNIIISALLAALVYLLAREAVGDRGAATAATLLYALGSMAWPHSRPFYSEALATLLAVLAFWALLRAMRGRALAWCVLAGLAAGAAALARNDSVFIYPALAVLLLWPLRAAERNRGRGPWPAWLAFALPVAFCGAWQLGLNWARFGHPLASAYADQTEGIQFTTPLLAGLYGLLLSPGKGMFFFSPALVLGLLGWGALARRHPGRQALVWALAAAILVPLVVHAKWQNWPGGWTWGPRHIFGIHAFLAVPAAAWVLENGRHRAGRIAILVLLVVGIGVQLLGSLVNFNEFHLRFFRSPGDPTAFFVVYDDHDRAFWEQHYQLLYREEPAEPWRQIMLFPPAPIHDSLYHPQRGVWAGYPRLIREGRLDNFWLRLAGGQP